MKKKKRKNDTIYQARKFWLNNAPVYWFVQAVYLNWQIPQFNGHKQYEEKNSQTIIFHNSLSSISFTSTKWKK